MITTTVTTSVMRLPTDNRAVLGRTVQFGAMRMRNWFMVSCHQSPGYQLYSVYIIIKAGF